jgi:hypothetical protein
VSQGRGDSDLEDVWSDVSGEVDRGGELTEFDFNPPSLRKPEKKQEVQKPRPPLTSDLEVPALGASPEPVPRSPPPMLEGPSLAVGAVLEGSSNASLLADARIEKRPATEPENRTMIGDAESAAIARAVSRSLLTGVVQQVTIPPILERAEVNKVLMGQRAEGAPEPGSAKPGPAKPGPAKPGPPKPGPPPVPAADDPLALEPDEEDAADPPTEPPLELAYDPHRTASPVPPAPRAPALHRTRASFPMKWLVLILGAIVVIAAGVRLFVR